MSPILFCYFTNIVFLQFKYTIFVYIYQSIFGTFQIFTPIIDVNIQFIFPHAYNKITTIKIIYNEDVLNMFTKLVGLRLVIGICFIGYGLLLYALEKYDGLPTFNIKIKTNGYINGFTLMVVGVLICSTSFINFIISSIASIALLLIESYFINKKL